MRVATLLVLLGACGFHGSAAPDAPVVAGDSPASGSGGGSGSGSGANPDAMVGECGGKLWVADFASDPTQQDLNGDGIEDWALRNTANPFPTDQLVNGIWSAPSSGLVLDTQPKQPFTTRTIIHARMRGTTLGAVQAHGAVVWINVGYAADHTFAPVFIDAKLTDTSPQTESFSSYTKSAVGVEQRGVFESLDGDDFHVFTLDINPAQLTALLAYDTSSTTLTLTRQAPNPSLPDPGDQWASVTPFSTGADFDYVTVEACP